MTENKPNGLPDLNKVIEQAKKLKQSGMGEGVKIVVQPEGIRLTIDEHKSATARKTPDSDIQHQK